MVIEWAKKGFNGNKHIREPKAHVTVIGHIFNILGSQQSKKSSAHILSIEDQPICLTLYPRNEQLSTLHLEIEEENYGKGQR